MGMSQELPLNGFRWIKKFSEFNEVLIKNYDENSNKGYIYEVDVEHPKNFLNFQSDLRFLAERKKTKKFNKLVCSIHDRKLCCSHKSSKTSIKRWIDTKKHRVTQFNKKAWLKTLT